MRSDLAIVSVSLCALVACAPASAVEPESGPGGTVTGTITGGKPGGLPLVVFLDGKRAKPTKPKLHSVGQKGLKFRPGFLVIAAGDEVEFPNDDNVSHNVFSVSRPKTFDLGLYNPGANKIVAFDKTGVIDLFCNVHENMHAVIAVVPSRFSAPVGDDGYRIERVAPGSYEAVLWDGGTELMRTAAVVRDGKVTRLNFEVPRRKK